MDARIAGQIGGVGHLIPTRGESPVGEPRPQTVDAVKRAPNASSSGDAQVDLSDSNGDGTVEHWSYAHGGDSVTTFKPPPSGAAGANARKIGHPPRGSAPLPPPAQGSPRTNAHASTTAAMHHAHEAYQRDGGPAAPAPHAAPSTPTPTVTAPSAPAPSDASAAGVTQSSPSRALPSPRP